MVERLYRGKRIDNGEWVVGIPWIFSPPVNKAVIVYAMGLVGEDDDTSRYCECHEVDPSTIGQYTGLTDKNGKKIFEGDIFIDPDYPDAIYQVDYVDGAFVAKERTTNEQFFLRDFVVFGEPEVEVIDNVYDNHQLLEVN